jgi:hypothetical protein
LDTIKVANMPLTKITFGDNLPGYEGGEKSAPALIVIQVGLRRI